jgi:hypothetical protein
MLTVASVGEGIPFLTDKAIKVLLQPLLLLLIKITK